MATPAWSIPRGKRSNIQGNHSLVIPGPGTYDNPLNKKKTPTWRIGTAQRNSSMREDSPGPGAYNSPGKISKATPKYHFAGKYVANEKEINPGPGTYDLSKKDNETKLRGYTMQSRKSFKDLLSETPGPAAYEQNNSFVGHRAATVKIGRSKRNSLAEYRDSPGPGAYNIDVTSPSANPNGPKWGFGTETRKGLASMLKSTPGPGTYTYSNLFNSANKGAYIIPRRVDTTETLTAEIPGPAAYNPTLNTKKRPPTCRIGTATRDSPIDRRLSTPGPGNYSAVTPTKKGMIRIGTGVRTPINNRSITPGPGAYDWSPSKNDAPKHFMVPRRPDTAELTTCKMTPGPGAYTPGVDGLKKTMPAVRIGSSTRVDLNLSGDSPGPGTYNLRGKQEGPQYRFGNAIRESSLLNKSLDPGPGAYSVPPKFAELPRYAMPSRKNV